MAGAGRRIIIPQGLLDPDEINVITIPRNLSRNTPLLVTPARSEGGPLGTRLLPDFRDELASPSNADNQPGHLEATPRGCLSDPDRSKNTSKDKNVLFNTTPPSGMSQLDDSSRISNTSPPPGMSHASDASRISNVTPPSGMGYYDDSSRISNTSPPSGMSFACGGASGISNTTPPSGMGYYDDSSRISNTSPPSGMSYSCSGASRISNVTPPSGMGYYDDSSRISNTSPPSGMSYSCGGTSRISNMTPPSGMEYYDDSSRISNTSPPSGMSCSCGGASGISNTTPPSGMGYYDDSSRISNTTPPSGMSYSCGGSSRISNTTPPSGMGYYDDSSRISNTSPPSGMSYSCGSSSRISNTTPPSGMGYYDDNSRISNTSPPSGMSNSCGGASRISNTTPPSGMGYFGDSSRISNTSPPSGMAYSCGGSSRISNTTPPSGMSYFGDSSALTNPSYCNTQLNNTPGPPNTTPPFGMSHLGGAGMPRTPPPASFSNARSPSPMRSVNATQNLSRGPSSPPNLGNVTQPVPGGNSTFSRICSSGVLPGELGIMHVSSKSVTQINGGPIHNRTTTVDAPEAIDESSFHRIVTDQVHSLSGGTGEPVKSQPNFTLSSMYDSSAEVSAEDNTDFFGQVLAGNFNRMKSMTPSPERPFGKIPQRRGDCGFRPPYISSPVEEDMKMHMTGSTNPSTVYSHGMFSQFGQSSGDETTQSSVCGRTYPPARFQGRSFDQLKPGRPRSAPESDEWTRSGDSGQCSPNCSNRSGGGGGTFARPTNATYDQPPGNVTFAQPGNATFVHPGNGTFACSGNASYAPPANATYAPQPRNDTYTSRLAIDGSHPSCGNRTNQGNATYPQAKKTQRCAGQSLHSQIEAFPAAGRLEQTLPRTSQRTPPTFIPTRESSVYEDTSSNVLPSPTGNTAVGGGFRPMFCSTPCPNSNAFMDDVSAMPRSVRLPKPVTPGRNATYPPMRQQQRVANQSLRSGNGSPERRGLQPAAAYGSGRNLHSNNVSFRMQSDGSRGSDQQQDYSHISSCQEALCTEECAEHSGGEQQLDYSHISSCEEAGCTEDCSRNSYETSAGSGSSPPMATGGLRRGAFYGSGQNLYGGQSGSDFQDTSASGSPSAGGGGLRRGNFFGSGQNLNRSEASNCDCNF